LTLGYARPTRAFRGRVLREQRVSLVPLLLPLLLSRAR
jgi:hypothetical protein